VAIKFGNGVDLVNQKIVNLADPSSGTDGANKQYVDGVARGLRWKESVRAASTATGVLATAYENGDTLDGVVLATGDRILLKDQSTATENGIYTVNASGAPTRAADLPAASDAKGIAVTVTNGTVNNDRVYIQTNDPATVGTNNLAFSQLGGSGTTYTAGDGLGESPAGTFNVNTGTASATGLETSADTVRIAAAAAGNGLTGGGGSALSLASTTAGNGLTYTSGVLDVVGDSSITVSANSLGLATGVAGNGLTLTSGVLDVVGDSSITVSANQIGLASGVSGAGLTLTSGVLAVGAGAGVSVAADTVGVDSTVARVYAASIGDGSTTNIVVTHSLGTRDVQVTVRNASTPWEQIMVDNEATSTTTCTLRFAVAPTTNQYRVIVQGVGT
jgi:hypothetical protein